MNTTDHPLTQAEFETIYAKVPRLTVDIIVRDKAGAIYLTRRSNTVGYEACQGRWHLPGGTVRFGEIALDAVKRVAARELGITVTEAKNTGYLEYPSHLEQGLDWPVALVFEVTAYDGEVSANDEAREAGWFTALPHGMHADQDAFLVDKGYAGPAAS